ncbi:kinase-like domain-containing protein [Armillaria mellea]|nr:kinase-like domain-containing protein [Armillaria mellea]
MDATRLADGSKVVLKVVLLQKGELELEISQLFSANFMRRDPRNNAIPILDAFPILGVEDLALIVMPMFHYFASPDFHCRLEFIELFRQRISGLEFMHSNKIAHRDISVCNIVMDHRRVIPKGYHFTFTFSHDGMEWAHPTEIRCRVGPVDYYSIDFEFSEHFPDGIDKALVSGMVGQRVPEMKDSDEVLYNPFKVDVYQLGTAMLDIFEAYTWLNDFKPLLRRMISVDPDKRPTASEALRQFEHVVSRAGKSSLTWRI